MNDIEYKKHREWLAKARSCQAQGKPIPKEKENKKMKTFKVWAKQTAYIALEVKAKNYDEALQKAYDADAGDFEEDFSKAEHEVVEGMGQELKGGKWKQI